MLDIKFIRENPELIQTSARNKNISVDIDQILKLDQEGRQIQQELESLQAERNRLSKSMAQASPEERETIKTTVSGIKPRMEELTEQHRTLKDQLRELMLRVPAPARADVPIGKDDTENVVVKTWGKVPEFDFEPKDHVDLGEKLGMIDVERGVNLAGSRSYILKGDGARLEQAILRFTFDKLVAKGYTPMSVPVLVNEAAMVGTGYFPTGRDQAYWIEKDEMALVGTSEVSMTSYHAKEILKGSDLPIRFMASSTCFRREAGTYGKDTRGLYRVHQFQKVEQVIIAPADPAQSEQLHTELLTNAEEVLQALEVPYRVVYVCTGDLGQGQVRKHDIESWMPSRAGYGETHSCSTFHDFQARRLETRYRDENGDIKYCYTLNNTAIATPRAMIAVMECHQTKDGRIRIPQALRPYMGGQELI